ncbi:O-methylsterigmatocystin oxidoreductase [Dichomitus squalens]|uniref:O-methylsterigmatocystin oxidoreductase n=1 Tax=Dichomitus squalens TaxID=114155 RepID=A0A4Q9MCJ7_9APHY|nr:O-methylsterigmatocystin oxidoreductase [Dichomitus squalens]TBU59799.1 O-methylsterigmatocystin oxidoreductase [Dichomitus squalens]
MHSSRAGDIVYLDALGTPMIILGSHEASIDLLEKRSSIYSDRHLALMAQITGFGWLFSMMAYGPQWRKTRSAFHQCMNLAAIPRFRPVQELETKKYLLKLLRDPSGFAEHGRHLIGAIIMRVAYGIDVEEEGNHKYVKIAEDAMDVFNVVFQPGRYLVQTIPSLRHIPSWFPGVKFKRDFARWIPIQSILITRYLWSQRGGHAHESIASILLDRVEDKNKDEMDTAKRAAAAAYIAGADTTLSTLSTFLAAMASHPEAQKCAQKELSRVIGSDRLPTLADKEDLPYVMAIVKECMRWRSVVPLAVPHFSIEEDVYMGYRIPKGSIVLSNIWSYSRDERYYPDPEAFRPERFLTEERKLDSTVLNPSHFVFGYGRRICPGRHFAEASLFMILSSVLHVFNIRPPLDKERRPLQLEVKMTNGVVSYPEAFDCIITPRSASTEALIRSSCSD